MRILLALALLLAQTTPALAAELPVSAYRHPDEPYEVAAQRNLRARDMRGDTAVELAVPAAEFDVNDVVLWPSRSSVEDAFAKMRDERHIAWYADPQFMRRASWLYPDDGCFARAAVSSDFLESQGHIRPTRIYAFGSLKVRTPNHPAGSVSWWYHVANAVRVGQLVLVLDPAVKADEPLSLARWLTYISPNPGAVTVAACSSYSYSPEGRCKTAPESDEASGEANQQYYFNFEWNRLLALGRNPQLELGDQPPWMQGL